MENCSMEVAPEMEKVVAAMAKNEDKVLAYMALSFFTETTGIEPMELIKGELVWNIQRASTWEDIKETQLDFAEQVLDMFPENYDETYKFIQDLTPLLGEALENYLKEECGFFLFRPLNIAFSMDKKIVKKYLIKQVA